MTKNENKSDNLSNADIWGEYREQFEKIKVEEKDRMVVIRVNDDFARWIKFSSARWFMNRTQLIRYALQWFAIMDAGGLMKLLVDEYRARKIDNILKEK